MLCIYLLFDKFFEKICEVLFERNVKCVVSYGQEPKLNSINFLVDLEHQIPSKYLM
jgi:hypothetical protein